MLRLATFSEKEFKTFQAKSYRRIAVLYWVLFQSIVALRTRVGTGILAALKHAE